MLHQDKNNIVNLKSHLFAFNLHNMFNIRIKGDDQYEDGHYSDNEDIEDKRESDEEEDDIDDEEALEAFRDKFSSRYIFHVKS